MLRLFRLPDLVFLQVLETMYTIDVIRLNIANGRRMKNYFRNFVSLGNITVIIGLDKYSSSFRVGKFAWEIFKKCFWYMPNYRRVSLSPMPFEASDHTFYPDQTLWYSAYTNTEEVALTIVTWILKMFPKTNRSVITIYFPNDIILNMLEPIDVSNFKEIKIEADKDCDARTSDLLNHIVKDRDVALLQSGGRRGYTSKIAQVKNLEEEPLPLQSINYFKNFFDLEHSNYVILSGKGVEEAHLQTLVNNWMTGNSPDLVFIHVKAIKDLNVTKIVEKKVMKDWDEAEIEQYRALTNFTEYFNETGIVIRSESGEEASIHVNNSIGTFTMVVWNTLSTNPAFILHNHIAF